MSTPLSRRCSSPPPCSGVRVELAGDDTRDAGLEERIDARRRRAVVRAGLERDVDRRAAGSLAGSLECDDLGVRAALSLVPAFADDLTVGDDDRADDRIRVRRAAAVLRELDGALQEAGLHARDPKLLAVELPAALAEQWRHEPEWLASLPELVTECAAEWNLDRRRPSTRRSHSSFRQATSCSS